MGVAEITSTRSGDIPQEPEAEGSPALFAAERRDDIALRTTVQGRVGVAELAELYAVTPETVRRDLHALERAGRVQRVHGGAIPPQQRAAEPTARSRRSERSAAKTAIARAALEHVPTGPGSILLDGGTTTGALAALLAEPGAAPRERLTVVTNAPAAGIDLARADGVEVHLLGGRLRDTTETVVGASAAAALSRLSADVLFLGTNGISGQFGLTTPSPEEARGKEAMVARSQLVVLLADSAKFGQEHLCTFAELTDVDVLITDATPTGELAQALHAAEIEVVTA